MIANSTLSAAAERVDLRRLPAATLVAAAAAAAGNLLLYLIVTGVFGTTIEVQLGGPTAPVTPLPVALVIIMSALPALFAAGLLWLLNRFVARPFAVFQGIAIVAALLSLGGPLTLQVGTASKVALSLMHIVAAVAIVLALRRRAGQAA